MSKLMEEPKCEHGRAWNCCGECHANVTEKLKKLYSGINARSVKQYHASLNRISI